MPKVLVIIVCYNALRWLDKCINSVQSSTVPSTIFIVDNGSTDGTQDYINNNYPNIIFQQSRENLGFGKANNIGVKYAINNNFDYIYLLNQDAWILPDTIEKLIKFHQNNSKYGILSPIQLQANSKFLDNNFASIVCNFHSNRNIINDLYFGKSAEIYDVPFVMAAHWLISKDCFSKVGGFSHTFPHYGEDNNYIDRAIYHGFKVGILPKCEAIHDREERVDSQDKRMYLDYISILVKISNIHNICTHCVLYCIYSSILSIFRYKSIKPFLYLLKILNNWNIIMKNRNVTKGYSAFLND